MRKPKRRSHESESRPTSARSRKAKQSKFLEAFVKTKTVAGAVRKVGIDRQTHTLWLETDPAYRSQFKDAELDLADEIEEKVRERAFYGADEPIVRKGEVTWIRKPSDRLLELLMRAKCADALKEKDPRSFEQQFELTVAERERIDQMTDAELDEFNAANEVIARLMGVDDAEPDMH